MVPSSNPSASELRAKKEGASKMDVKTNWRIAFVNAPLDEPWDMPSKKKASPKRFMGRKRKLTLASVVKQATKAGIEIARYEVVPDGKIIIVTGTPEPTDASNPWLVDMDKVTKQ
jgi:hypothetical protein